jgi:hypothetical protein
MSLVSAKGAIFVPQFDAIGISSALMDATGERYASICQVQKAGAIHQLYVALGTVTEEDTLK